MKTTVQFISFVFALCIFTTTFAQIKSYNPPKTKTSYDINYERNKPVTGLYDKTKKNADLIDKEYNAPEVVYIIDTRLTGKKKVVSGTEFDVAEPFLVGIISRKYFDRNKSRVTSKYPNCQFLSGKLIGTPKTSGTHPYLEPGIGDQLKLYTKNLANSSYPPSLPATCRKKGDVCKMMTDLGTQVYVKMTDEQKSGSTMKMGRFQIVKLKNTQKGKYRTIKYVNFRKIL